MAASAFQHSLLSVESSSPPYYVQQVREYQARTYGVYHSKHHPARDRNAPNPLANYFGESGGSGPIPEASAVGYLIAHTSRNLYQSYCSSSSSSSNDSANDTSTFLLDGDNISTDVSAIQTALSTATLPAASEVENKGVKVSPEASAQALPVYHFNDIFQSLAETSFAQIRRSGLWEGRQAALRDFLSADRIKSGHALIAYIRKGLWAKRNEKGNRNIGTYTAIDEDDQSFISVTEGVFAHVWRSAAEGRRYITATQRLWQGLFESRASQGFGTLVSTFIVLRGTFITFTALAPIVGDSLPCGGNTAVGAVTGLLCAMLGGRAEGDDEDDDESDSDSDEDITVQLRRSSSFAAKSTKRTYVSMPRNARVHYGADGRYYFTDPTVFGVEIEGKAPPPKKTFGAAALPTAPTPSSATLRPEALPFLFENGLADPANEHRTQTLKSEIGHTCVDKVVKHLEKAVTAQKLNEVVQQGLITNTLHAAGVNMRLLGLLHAKLTSEHPASSRTQAQTTIIEGVESEMLCRTVKLLIRAEWSNNFTEDDDNLVDRVNRLYKSLSSHGAVWDQVMMVMREKFGLSNNFEITFQPKYAKILTWYATPKMGIGYANGTSRFEKITQVLPGSCFIQVPEVMRLASGKQIEALSKSLMNMWGKASSIRVELSADAYKGTVCAPALHFLEKITRCGRVILHGTLVSWNKCGDNTVAMKQFLDDMTPTLPTLSPPRLAWSAAMMGHVTVAELFGEQVPPAEINALLQAIDAQFVFTPRAKGKSIRSAENSLYACRLYRTVASLMHPHANMKPLRNMVLSKAFKRMLEHHTELLRGFFDPTAKRVKDSETTGGGESLKGRRGSIMRGNLDPSAVAQLLDVRTNPSLADEIWAYCDQFKDDDAKIVDSTLTALIAHGALSLRSTHSRPDVKVAWRLRIDGITKDMVNKAQSGGGSGLANDATFLLQVALTRLLYLLAVQSVQDAASRDGFSPYAHPEVCCAFLRCIGFATIGYNENDLVKGAGLEAFLSTLAFSNSCSPLKEKAGRSTIAPFDEGDAADILDSVISASFANAIALLTKDLFLPLQKWWELNVIMDNLRPRDAKTGKRTPSTIYKKAATNEKLIELLTQVDNRNMAAVKLQTAFRTVFGQKVNNPLRIAKDLSRLETKAVVTMTGLFVMEHIVRSRMWRDSLICDGEELQRSCFSREEAADFDTILLSFHSNAAAFALEKLEQDESRQRFFIAADEALTGADLVIDARTDEMVSIFQSIIEQSNSGAALTGLQASEETVRFTLEIEEIEAASLLLFCRELDGHALAITEEYDVVKAALGVTITQQEESTIRQEIEIEEINELVDDVLCEVQKEEELQFTLMFAAFKADIGAEAIVMDERDARFIIEAEELEVMAEAVPEQLLWDLWLTEARDFRQELDMNLGGSSLDSEEKEGRLQIFIEQVEAICEFFATEFVFPVEEESFQYIVAAFHTGIGANEIQVDENFARAAIELEEVDESAEPYLEQIIEEGELNLQQLLVQCANDADILSMCEEEERLRGILLQEEAATIVACLAGSPGRAEDDDEEKDDEAEEEKPVDAASDEGWVVELLSSISGLLEADASLELAQLLTTALAEDDYTGDEEEEAEDGTPSSPPLPATSFISLCIEVGVLLPEQKEWTVLTESFENGVTSFMMRGVEEGEAMSRCTIDETYLSELLPMLDYLTTNVIIPSTLASEEANFIEFINHHELYVEAEHPEMVERDSHVAAANAEFTETVFLPRWETERTVIDSDEHTEMIDDLLVPAETSARTVFSSEETSAFIATCAEQWSTPLAFVAPLAAEQAMERMHIFEYSCESVKWVRYRSTFVHFFLMLIDEAEPLARRAILEAEAKKVSALTSDTYTRRFRTLEKLETEARHAVQHSADEALVELFTTTITMQQRLYVFRERVSGLLRLYQRKEALRRLGMHKVQRLAVAGFMEEHEVAHRAFVAKREKSARLRLSKLNGCVTNELKARIKTEKQHEKFLDDSLKAFFILAKALTRGSSDTRLALLPPSERRLLKLKEQGALSPSPLRSSSTQTRPKSLHVVIPRLEDIVLSDYMLIEQATVLLDLAVNNFHGAVREPEDLEFVRLLEEEEDQRSRLIGGDDEQSPRPQRRHDRKEPTATLSFGHTEEDQLLELSPQFGSPHRNHSLLDLLGQLSADEEVKGGPQSPRRRQSRSTLRMESVAVEKIRDKITKLQAKETNKRLDITEHMMNFFSQCRMEWQDQDSLWRATPTRHRKLSLVFLIPLLSDFNLPPRPLRPRPKPVPEKDKKKGRSASSKRKSSRDTVIEAPPPVSRIHDFYEHSIAELRKTVLQCQRRREQVIDEEVKIALLLHSKMKVAKAEVVEKLAAKVEEARREELPHRRSMKKIDSIGRMNPFAEFDEALDAIRRDELTAINRVVSTGETALDRDFPAKAPSLLLTTPSTYRAAADADDSPGVTFTDIPVVTETNEFKAEEEQKKATGTPPDEGAAPSTPPSPPPTDNADSAGKNEGPNGTSTPPQQRPEGQDPGDAPRPLHPPTASDLALQDEMSSLLEGIEGAVRQRLISTQKTFLLRYIAFFMKRATHVLQHVQQNRTDETALSSETQLEHDAVSTSSADQHGGASPEFSASSPTKTQLPFYCDKRVMMLMERRRQDQLEAKQAWRSSSSTNTSAVHFTSTHSSKSGYSLAGAGGFTWSKAGAPPIQPKHPRRRSLSPINQQSSSTSYDLSSVSKSQDAITAALARVPADDPRRRSQSATFDHGSPKRRKKVHHLPALED